MRDIIPLALTILGIFSAQARAALFEEQVAKLFSQAAVATSVDAAGKWLCVYEDEGRLRGASNYGFSLDNGKPVVTEFGLKGGIHQLIAKNGALVAEEQGDDGTAFVSFRALDTAKGRRLIIEESASRGSMPASGKASVVTGYAPGLYCICTPEQEILGSP